MPSLQVMKRERESCIEDDNNGTTPIQTPQPNEKATPLIKLERDHSISTSMDDQLRDSNTTIIKREITPARSDTSSLSDLSSFTPKLEKHGSAFALLNGNVPPPAKRPKLTFAEKEAQIIMKEIKAREKAQEKAEQQAKREADASQRRFEKAQREFEREEERKRKDAELEERRAAKAAKDAEREKAKAAKEEEKRKKEEEKQKLEDEKKKKERAQPKLMSFFSTPKPKTQTEDAVSTLQKSNSMDTPSKNVSPIQPSDYEKMFPPFFVKEHVTLAPNNWFAKERWGSQNLEMELDNYISRASQQPYTIALDLPTLFNCPDLTLQARGRNIIPVRTIMEKVLGKAEKPIDLTTDSQNTQIRKTRRLLQSVPYKIISFSQDVRPSYTGTHTRHELAKLQKLARRPCKPELEDLHYDYDSEAEWVENDDDEGDAEDLHSIISEDEDEEDDGDPDGFIDDADAENIKRTALPADQEPQSTGLCWENHRRKGPNLKMYDYRMEVMNGMLQSSIMFVLTDADIKQRTSIVRHPLILSPQYIGVHRLPSLVTWILLVCLCARCKTTHPLVIGQIFQAYSRPKPLVIQRAQLAQPVIQMVTLRCHRRVLVSH